MDGLSNRLITAIGGKKRGEKQMSGRNRAVIQKKLNESEHRVRMAGWGKGHVRRERKSLLDLQAIVKGFCRGRAVRALVEQAFLAGRHTVAVV